MSIHATATPETIAAHIAEIVRRQPKGHSLHQALYNSPHAFEHDVSRIFCRHLEERETTTNDDEISHCWWQLLCMRPSPRPRSPLSSSRRTRATRELWSSREKILNFSAGRSAILGNLAAGFARSECPIAVKGQRETA
jgi:hypothetical protein